MTFLLDNNVVSYFFQARRNSELAKAAGIVPCAISDVVRDELIAYPVLGKAIEKWLPESHIEVLPILVGSEADTIQQRLDVGLATRRGKGERSSIALAGGDPSLTFIAMDKAGLWIALRELWQPGERIIGLPVFLRKLVDARALDGVVADDVLNVSKHVHPTWWADWRTAPAPA